MNRPIKFKVWFSEAKKMMSAINISLPYRLQTLWHFTETYSKLSEIPPIFLQYTGLKDKNDLEIYEGDIVRLEYYGVGMGLEGLKGFSKIPIMKMLRAPVIFRKGCFDIDKNVGIITDISDSHMVEVLGNIYENPELMDIEDDEEWR